MGRPGPQRGRRLKSRVRPSGVYDRDSLVGRRQHEAAADGPAGATVDTPDAVEDELRVVFLRLHSESPGRHAEERPLIPGDVGCAVVIDPDTVQARDADEILTRPPLPVIPGDQTVGTTP